MENIERKPERGDWRAKRLDNGDFFIGWKIMMFRQLHLMDPEDCNTAYPIDPSTLGEYTGIQDTEEKPLFEGDIVTLHQFLFDGSEVESILTALIEYDPGQAAFFLTRIENDFYQDYTGYRRGEGSAPICMFYGLHEESFTRIGNKWDNPNLLGGA